MTDLVEMLVERGDAARLTESTIGAFINDADGRLALVFFSGDPAKRLETADVAVVARELARLHAGDVTLGVIAREDEAALMKRFGVVTLPALAVFHAGSKVDLFPKIQDWTVYAERLSAALAAAGRGVAAA